MSSKRKSDKYKHGIEITETADIVILRKKIHVPPIAVHVFWDPAVKRFTLWVHRYQILISWCRRARISNTQNRQSTHCFCFDILTKANTRDRKKITSHTLNCLLLTLQITTIFYKGTTLTRSKALALLVSPLIHSPTFHFTSNIDMKHSKV